jgi:two-component system response regulator NreC
MNTGSAPFRFRLTTPSGKIISPDLKLSSSPADNYHEIGNKTVARTQTNTTIVIADSHLLFRRGLRTLLSSKEGLEVLDEASEIDEALGKVRKLSPDILILDLAMVRTDHQDSTMAIRQTQPSTSLLCLTRQDGEHELETAVGAGAQGYIRRDTSPADMIAAIQQVAWHAGDLNPNGISRVVPDLQALAKNSDRFHKGTGLTGREKEVVRLLAEGKTVRQVASDLSLSMKTIEAHKLNLMRKLDIHNRASLVEYAVRNGMSATVPVS